MGGGGIFIRFKCSINLIMNMKLLLKTKNNIMTTQTMVWSKYGGTEIKEYPDLKLYEDDDIIIMKYYGQNCGGRDHMITPDALMMIKNKNNSYINIGKIINVLNTGTEKITRWVDYKREGAKDMTMKVYDVKIYKLVITKMELTISKTKNEMCGLFNLSVMNSFERTHGITSHTFITNE